MYPDNIICLSMYQILFIGGIIVALIIFTKYTNKRNVPIKVQNFYFNLSIVTIAGGYVFAILFQALYNFFEKGYFEFSGITFLGGLIGGVAIFLGGYKLFAKEEEKKYFQTIIQVVPCSVLIAHGLGRIGCFCAGCCHGIQTDSIFGVQFPGMAYKVYPTQLFEAVFLFIMFGICSFLYLKNKNRNVTIYLISYGVFRFLLEFIRGDYRGQFIVSFISPSQVWSLVLIIAGILLIAFRKKI